MRYGLEVKLSPSQLDHYRTDEQIRSCAWRCLITSLEDNNLSPQSVTFTSMERLKSLDLPDHVRYRFMFDIQL